MSDGLPLRYNLITVSTEITVLTTPSKDRWEDGTSLSKQVYEYLADEIVRGTITYGQKLNIKRIAAYLHVSSMPIRDAIKRLEYEGIVVVSPRSHCYVRVPTKREALETIDARRMIELFALGCVWETVGAADLVPLRTILEAMRPIALREADSGSRGPAADDYIDLDRRFHTELCALAHNEAIGRFYRQIAMHLSMSFSYGIGVCHGVGTTFGEHEAIIGHLQANSRQAVQALEEHLLKSRRNIIQEPGFQSLPD